VRTRPPAAADSSDGDAVKRFQLFGSGPARYYIIDDNNNILVCMKYIKIKK